MKIGVVVDNEFYNDIRVTNECKIFCKNGHKVYVLCFDFGTNIKKSDIENFNIVVQTIKINRKLKNILYALMNFIDIYSWFWSKKIKKFISKNNINALHVHDLYMSKSAQYATMKFKSLKVSLDLHENYAYAVDSYKWMHKPFSKCIIRPDAWKKKEGKYLEYADNIIVLSEEFKTNLQLKYPNLKEKLFAVYPNVPDLQQLLTYEIDTNIINLEDSFTLFYFGAVSIRRGMNLLFNSIETLSINIPEIKLLIIGPVDKAEQTWFNDKIQNPKIKDFIIYFPWKDISTLPSFISISDICLSPLHKNPQHESGIANKVYQYMLFEKPILVSNCEPQKNLVVKYKCGISHIWDSEKDFVQKVIYLYNNKAIAHEMGIAGRNAVMDHLNNNEFGKQILQLYS